MKQIVLISDPTDTFESKLKDIFFNSELKNRIFAYMPSEGNNPRNSIFMPFWKKAVEKEKGIFKFIDNSKNLEESFEEREILESADYLMITGGNIFSLLNNLRESGLDKSIKKFFQKRDYKFLGMSAGAIVISPSIEIADIKEFSFGGDENKIGLKDLTGLNLIDFVPLCHYDIKNDIKVLKKFIEKKSYKIIPIENNQVLEILIP